MLPTTETSQAGLTLFGTVSTDYLGLGMGSLFKAKEVRYFLELNKEDVAHLAAVSSKSVSFDNVCRNRCANGWRKTPSLSIWWLK